MQVLPEGLLGQLWDVSSYRFILGLEICLGVYNRLLSQGARRVLKKTTADPAKAVRHVCRDFQRRRANTVRMPGSRIVVLEAVGKQATSPYAMMEANSGNRRRQEGSKNNTPCHLPNAHSSKKLLTMTVQLPLSWGKSTSH